MRRVNLPDEGDFAASAKGADARAGVSYADLRTSRLVIHHMPGHFIRRLQQVAVKRFMAEVGEDITPVQFAALAAAAHRPNIDQASLAALIGYDRATIGGVIDRLEARGWLARASSRSDRRVKNVRLTLAGQATLKRAMPRVRSVQDSLLESLGSVERKSFERLCLKILAHHLG